MAILTMAILTMAILTMRTAAYDIALRFKQLSQYGAGVCCYGCRPELLVAAHGEGPFAGESSVHVLAVSSVEDELQP